MSRGLGPLQRRILGALVDRRDSDFYDAEKARDFIDPSDIPAVRARWRWYTLDLVDLAHFGDPRSERVSLRRAVHGLARTRRLETATSCPYDQPFGAYENDFGEYVGGIDLDELSTVDPRWPSRGRCLWFRLPPPPSLEDVPGDDQMWFLKDIADRSLFAYDVFREFTGTRDRRRAWDSEVGRFVHWLFCGPAPE
jgi:hypothetical protein